MQDVQRAPPFLPVHQVVPVGDDVVDRASVVAERNAAVHAPGGLLPGLFVVQAHHELAPVLQALLRCFGGFLEPLEFHKTSDFSHGRSSGGQLFRAGRTPHFAQCAAVFGGHDLDEFAARGFPVAQDFAGAEAAGIAEVVFDEPAQDGFVGIALAAALDAVPVLAVVLRQLLGVRRNRFELDHGQVAALPEAAVRVPYVGDAARHAGGEVAAGAAQHHHGAAGHVFATVVAGAFDHGGRPRVAHRKTLAGHAVEERFARQRAIQHGVADDDVVGPEPAEVIGRAHDDAAARQALADVVVAFAYQVQCDAVRQEGAEALAGRAVALDVDGVVGQAFVAVARRDGARQHRADGAVAVAHGRDERDLFAAFERGLAAFDKQMVQCAGQAVVLRFGLAPFGVDLRLVEHAREIQAPGLPVFDTFAHVQQVGAADQVVELADAQLGHDFAHFFGDEEEKVHHVLGLALELAAQHRILSGHAHRAGVQVALAHHDAAFHHQRRGCKAELVGAQQRRDHDVTAGFQLSVGLHADTAAQAVEHQGLLRFGQAQFPGRAYMLDRRHGRRTGAAVVAGDHDMVGLGLGHAGRHGAHPHFGHELDRDRRLAVDVFQVVNKLRQVFDGIDVVVRRRRDQAHARHRIAQLGDVVRYLVAGQLAAFAGLGALRHLDLDLVGACQVFGRDAEAARGDLLDARTQRVAGLQRHIGFDAVCAQDGRQGVAIFDGAFVFAHFGAVAQFVFAAFAGIRLAADAVHGHRQHGVGFGGNGAQRHGAGSEALDDFLGRLDLVQRNGARGVEAELEQPAQRHVAAALVVDDLRVLFVRAIVIGARGVLQLGDGVGRPHVFFAAHPESVFAACVQVVGQHGVGAERGAVQAQCFFGHLENADAFDVGSRAG